MTTYDDTTLPMPRELDRRQPPMRVHYVVETGPHGGEQVRVWGIMHGETGDVLTHLLSRSLTLNLEAAIMRERDFAGQPGFGAQNPPLHTTRRQLGLHLPTLGAVTALYTVVPPHPRLGTGEEVGPQLRIDGVERDGRDISAQLSAQAHALITKSITEHEHRTLIEGAA
jgi:hypothetical protein